jgi:hypothetical protein
MSTTDSGYMALSDALRKLLSRMYYITKLGISIVQPTVLRSDDQAAITLANGQGNHRHKAYRHMISYHFIRDHLQRGNLEIAYVPSEKHLHRFHLE